MLLRALLLHGRRNAIAYLALFLALGGTSVAAGLSRAPANSVRSAQVIDHSLLARDFKRGALQKGPRGAAGLAGAAGPRGATGSQGAPAHTFAAAAGNTTTPPSGMFTTVQSLNVAAPSGTLFVRGYADNVTAACGSFACSITLGLYVDGQPLAGGGIVASAAPGCEMLFLCFATASHVTLTGIAGGLAPGTHTVALGKTSNAIPANVQHSRLIAMPLG